LEQQHQEKPVSPLRRPFVVAGAVVGALLGAWYLYNNFGRVTTVADPIWTRFVNVALLMFLPIYAANLLRRVVQFFWKRR